MRRSRCPHPRPTAVNPSAPTIAAPAAIFFRYIPTLPSPTPYEFATLVSLNSCPRSAIWCKPRRDRGSHTPPHCTNGRRLGPGELLVGHQACLGDSGGHTSWTRRTPGSTIYSNSWWEHHHRLNRPPAGIPTRPVSATRNGGAIGTDRLGMARSQRRRSQAKFRTDGVS